MRNQTFLRAAGGLAETPCRWRVNRPSPDLAVDSFQLFFWSWIEKSSDFPDRFETKNEMRVHTRFARTCNIFRVSGVIVRMPYLPSRKVRWANSICLHCPASVLLFPQSRVITLPTKALNESERFVLSYTRRISCRQREWHTFVSEECCAWNFVGVTVTYEKTVSLVFGYYQSSFVINLCCIPLFSAHQSQKQIFYKTLRNWWGWR